MSSLRVKIHEVTLILLTDLLIYILQNTYNIVMDVFDVDAKFYQHVQRVRKDTAGEEN